MNIKGKLKKALLVIERNIETATSDEEHATLLNAQVNALAALQRYEGYPAHLNHERIEPRSSHDKPSITKTPPKGGTGEAKKINAENWGHSPYVKFQEDWARQIDPEEEQARADRIRRKFGHLPPAGKGPFEE